MSVSAAGKLAAPAGPVAAETTSGFSAFCDAVSLRAASEASSTATATSAGSAAARRSDVSLSR
jgi:hypothetical protein